MVYRKRVYRRKRPYRSTFGRRGKLMHQGNSISVKHVPRGLFLKTHHFKQRYYPSTNTFLPATSAAYIAPEGKWKPFDLSSPQQDVAASLSFRIDDLPQWPQFSALFDAYRINKVVVKVIPQALVNQPVKIGGTDNNVLSGTGNDTTLAFLGSVIDYDDNNLPTSQGQMMEYETYKAVPGSKTLKRVIVPAIASSVYKDTGTTIAYGQKRKAWIDAAYGDVPHYGMKFYLQGDANPAHNICQIYKIEVTAYISFKQTR